MLELLDGAGGISGCFQDFRETTHAWRCGGLGTLWCTLLYTDMLHWIPPTDNTCNGFLEISLEMAGKCWKIPPAQSSNSSIKYVVDSIHRISTYHQSDASDFFATISVTLLCSSWYWISCTHVFVSTDSATCFCNELSRHSSKQS